MAKGKSATKDKADSADAATEEVAFSGAATDEGAPGGVEGDAPTGDLVRAWNTDTLRCIALESNVPDHVLSTEPATPQETVYVMARAGEVGFEVLARPTDNVDAPFLPVEEADGE